MVVKCLDLYICVTSDKCYSIILCNIQLSQCWSASGWRERDREKDRQTVETERDKQTERWKDRERETERERERERSKFIRF